MKKIIIILFLIVITALLCINTTAISNEEVEIILNTAIISSSFCGPSYPLDELLNSLSSSDIQGIPSLKEQKEKYKNIPSDYNGGNCAYLSENELYDLFCTVFSDGLAENYITQMRSLCDSAGLPVKREINGVIYDFGTYGDPGGTRIEDIKITETENDEYKIHVEYRYGWDLGNGNKPPLLADDLTLKRIDGKLKFTDFVSLNDKAYLSVYPQDKDKYPQKWINPQTADAPVIAVCALSISAAAAVVLLKKKKAI